jgi:hypothetical protein
LKKKTQHTSFVFVIIKIVYKQKRYKKKEVVSGEEGVKSKKVGNKGEDVGCRGRGRKREVGPTERASFISYSIDIISYTYSFKYTQAANNFHMIQMTKRQNHKKRTFPQNVKQGQTSTKSFAIPVCVQTKRGY